MFQICGSFGNMIQKHFSAGTEIKTKLQCWACSREDHQDGLQGKGEGISSTLYWHSHPLHEHSDTSRVITLESSPLHIASGRTRTGNPWFTSASC